MLEHPAVFASCAVKGFLDDLYATLVLKLADSESFQLKELWRGPCGVPEDGRAVGKEMREFADVRWMEISSVLKRESQNGTKPVKQIEFKGERLDMTSVRQWREKVQSA